MRECSVGPAVGGRARGLKAAGLVGSAEGQRLLVVLGTGRCAPMAIVQGTRKVAGKRSFAYG